ncbi:stalk domain-containing protein [Loigolactobacillus zhaoyuanensis]|uniref:Stalk domain-containing protein n=1 Tax=Loigolactobacillus zhaoyuanensis TaxID=2486017 RepID=A0ABW8UH04_9LACO|nr:stalk domain-containing protein [Loigolactobacillus zhaoyuanensis]
MAEAIEERLRSYYQWNLPVKIVIDDLELSATGIMSNAQIYVPLKTLFKEIKQPLQTQGFNVTGTYKGNLFDFTIGAQTLRLNGITYHLDAAPFGTNQEIYVTTFFVAVVTQHIYEWFDESRLLVFEGLENETFQIAAREFAPFSVLPPQFKQADIGGQGQLPTLEWAGMPAGTKSMALFLTDEHPLVAGYSYWTVMPLAADVTRIAANEPHQQQTMHRFQGVAPVQNTGYHEYLFRIFALDTERPIYTGQLNTVAEARAAFDNHLLDVAVYPVFAKL